MLKYVTLLLLIHQFSQLSCPSNEINKNYNLINPSSSLTTEVCTPCEDNQISCKEGQQSVCITGYFLLHDQSENKNQCVSDISKLPGCSKIQKSDQTCMKCDEDYWQNSEGNCIKKSASFLEKCKIWQLLSAIETCNQTLDGYGIEDEKFVSCIAFCSKCNDSSTCTECTQGYYLGQDNKSCKKKEGNCLVWKTQTEEECESCHSGYYKNKHLKNICYNQQCTCPSGTGFYPNCTITCTDTNCFRCSLASNCTKCKPTFYIKEDFTCGSCPSHCDTCDNDTACIKCSDGYYLDSGNCVQCPENCKTCESSSVCLSCNDDTTLHGNNCVDIIQYCARSNDGTTCVECRQGYCLVDSTHCTATEVNNCNQCVSTTSCNLCNHGYYGNSCTACTINHCYSCSSETYCDSCNEGYILKKIDNTHSECVQCNAEISKYQELSCESNQYVKFPWLCTDLVDGCATPKGFDAIGTDEQFCLTCLDGYKYNAAQFKCEQCSITNCKVCNSNIATCDQCIDGYFSESNVKCTKCLSNCDKCESANVCLDCKTGYAFTPSLNECLKCSDPNCDWCSQVDVCVKCSTGYYYNSTNKICTACISTCQECYNQNSCYECKETYYLKDWGCYSCIENCQKCENGAICKTCKEGFIPNVVSTKCMNETLCKGNNPNCKKCDILDTVYCYECNENYYLDNAICKQCLDNCKICSNYSHCKECKSGYELNIDKTKCGKITENEASCFSIINGCIQCSTLNLQKCAFCASGSVPNDEGTCVCSDGYLLIDGKCLKQEKETVDFTSLSSTTLETLQSYIEQSTSGSNKATYTEKMLKQLNSLLTEVDSVTGQQSARLLLSLASTTTTLDAQNYYKLILKKICSTSGLDNFVYFTALSASDAFYITSNKTMRQDIYDYGFTNCVENYLKKANPNEIPLLKFSNSQFLIKELTIKENDNEDQTLSFSDSSVIATADLKAYLYAKSATKNYYIIAQSIDNGANPYKYTQNNTVLFESKIISVTIMSKENDEDSNPASNVDINLEKKTFSVVFNFEGTKCGHYDEEKLQWIIDGKAVGKICNFNHATHFAIFQEAIANNVTEAKNAFIMAVCSFIWILFIVLI